MIGRTLGHYEILAKLGEGGMGVVYKAHDSHLHRPVAIKVLPPDLVADAGRRQRFTQEARAASALNHPGIVTIHDIAHADGTDFIAMEYVEGKTLAELIRRGGLSLKDVLGYAVQAAAALAKAHAAGIVHRDLKPSNIMVTDDGLVKILDFGVAKLAHSEDVDPGLGAAETRTSGGHLVTEAGTVVGTAAYMSPEQAEGQKVDARSDIFSFGAVLYEMATGARAFQATTPALTLSAVVSSEPKPPSDLAKDLPRELERIILRCLRKDPARRFQHMEDLAVEIEEIKSESDTQLAAAHTASRSRRTPWVMGSMTAFAVIAATGAWFLWPDRTAPRASPTVAPLTALFGHERFATFSPDGNQVAFAWDGEKGDNTDIYVMPVGAGTPVRLTTDAAQDSAPAWSPDGNRIAFVRRRGSEGAIYLVTPPVVNSEQKLADIRPVDSPNQPFTTVSWFPDSRRLAVAERDADGQMNGIVMIPIGRDEPRKLVWTPLSAGTYHYPAVSPDGQSLAYALCRGQFNCNAYVMELARNLPSTNAPQRPLVEQSSFIRGIAWTADGRSLLYGVGSLRSYLWRVPVVGGEPERVELAGVHAAFPAVSRDGLDLAYTRLGSGADIWKFGASGLPESFLSSTLDDRNAQFSPDGKKIAFESRRLDKDTQIWIANADGTNATPLTDGADGVGGSPRWSPDSRWIVFDGQERDGRRAIYKVAAEGGRTILLHTPGAVPSWSHDGKWIYFSHGGGAREQDLLRIPSEDGDAVKVAVKVADNAGGNPLESPDGNLYYRKQTVSPGVLFARPRAGGQERRVLESMVATLLHQYFPVEDGIYYVAHPDPKLPFAHEVRFLDFRTGTHKTLHKFEARSGTGLTVSPDRKTIVYSGTKPSDGDNLMLIRNFR